MAEKMINTLLNIHNISSRNTYCNSKAKIPGQKHKCYLFVPVTWNIKQYYLRLYDKLVITEDILKHEDNTVGTSYMY